MSLTHDFRSELLKAAEKHSQPFCFSCYVPALSGRCEKCGSDDLMRLVPGVGVEWGMDWVVDDLVRTNLKEADVDAAFEESVSAAYAETVEIGWIEYDVAAAIKELDPVSWELAQSEWVDGEVSEGNLITFDNGSTHYWVADVEQFLGEHQADE